MVEANTSGQKDVGLSQLASLMNSKLDARTRLNILDMFDDRPIEVIDIMDPVNHNLTEEKLAKFMTKNDEFNDGAEVVPDYIIVDNFVDFFAENTNMECL